MNGLITAQAFNENKLRALIADMSSLSGRDMKFQGYSRLNRK